MADGIMGCLSSTEDLGRDSSPLEDPNCTDGCIAVLRCLRRREPRKAYPNMAALECQFPRYKIQVAEKNNSERPTPQNGDKDHHNLRTTTLESGSPSIQTRRFIYDMTCLSTSPSNKPALVLDAKSLWQSENGVPPLREF